MKYFMVACLFYAGFLLWSLKGRGEKIGPWYIPPAYPLPTEPTSWDSTRAYHQLIQYLTEQGILRCEPYLPDPSCSHSTAPKMTQKLQPVLIKKGRVQEILGKPQANARYLRTLVVDLGGTSTPPADPVAATIYLPFSAASLIDYKAVATFLDAFFQKGDLRKNHKARYMEFYEDIEGYRYAGSDIIQKVLADRRTLLAGLTEKP